MSKERYAEHTVAWELPNRDSVTKGNYNLADIETKYLPIQTEVVSDSKDHTIYELKQRIAELEEQLKNAIVPKFKIGQIVWFIDTRVNDFNENKYMLISFKIETIKVDNFDICYEDYWGDVMAQRDLFATKEEAQAKLKELQGE